MVPCFGLNCRFFLVFVFVFFSKKVCQFLSTFLLFMFHFILYIPILLFEQQRLLLYLLLQKQPSAKTITWLLDKVLKLNNFAFNNHNFIQVTGTAMGTRVAPNDANVYMGRLEDRFVYRTALV